MQGVTQWSIAMFSLLSASIEVEKLLFQASGLELLFLSPAPDTACSGGAAGACLKKKAGCDAALVLTPALSCTE